MAKWSEFEKYAKGEKNIARCWTTEAHRWTPIFSWHQKYSYKTNITNIWGHTAIWRGDNNSVKQQHSKVSRPGFKSPLRIPSFPFIWNFDYILIKNVYSLLPWHLITKESAQKVSAQTVMKWLSYELRFKLKFVLFSEWNFNCT